MTSTAAQQTDQPTAEPSNERDRRDHLAAWWERRLALPVVLAAAVSVPAVFLTMADDERFVLAGTAVNWASVVVLTGEAVMLFLLAGDRFAWAKRHWWKLAIAAAAIPAVILAVGPVQVLRLIQFVGALRILRASRIIKAGQVLARRSKLRGPWRYVPTVGGATLAAVFVAVVLADPTSTSRQYLERAGGWITWLVVILAGSILAAATFIVLRRRPDPHTRSRRSRDRSRDRISDHADDR
jgi:CsoR family transcriptional regulator, copper-sensing transcriptional repressor